MQKEDINTPPEQLPHAIIRPSATNQLQQLHKMNAVWHSRPCVIYCRTLNLFLISSLPNKSPERIENIRGKKSKIIMMGGLLRKAKKYGRQMLCLQPCPGGLISEALKALKAGVFEHLQ